MTALITFYACTGIITAGLAVASVGQRGNSVAFWKVPLVIAFWPLYVFILTCWWIGSKL